MRGRDGVGCMRRRAGLLGEVGGESLVEALHGDSESLAQTADELIGLHCLLAVVPEHRQRQPDDDALDFVLGDELGDPREACVAPRLLDDSERTRHRPGRIGDSDAGARRAVVEGEDLQPIAEAISLFAIS
jgi:hypothetical protein